ncbi:hypothetical protein FALBO_2128 [Fusarium albosuccineum]|uniref:Uncharacterized protein n=1 Tax=Fusarium albosuccineum TaxID=1237068 RepID=A0A8H4LNC1_9HYPO|nr:hypothetical protein FALBO_2128 [Fusarium albosuccineum]
MLGLSFTTFIVPVPKADGFWGSFIFPRRRPSTEIQYLETLEAGMFDEPLDARRRGLGLTDCVFMIRIDTRQDDFLC